MRNGLLLCLLWSLAACNEARQRSRGSGDEPIVFQASDVQVLGTSESIATVDDLEVLADGTVWVLNSIEPFFIGFDADGRVLEEHGRLGGGPGEFSATSGFVVGEIHGQTWVFDRQRHAMIRISRPDSARLEISLPEDAIPPGSLVPGTNLFLSDVVRTASLGDELLLPLRSDPPESQVRGQSGVFSVWLSAWTADLVALDPRTDSVRNVIALAEVLGDPTPHFDLTDAFLPFPLWYRLWTVCSDTEIRVHDRLRNQVRGFTRNGRELEPIALPPPRYDEMTREQFGRAMFDAAAIEAMGSVPADGTVEVSPADSARIIDRMMSRMKAPVDQLANLLPRYMDLRCDENGTIWLQPFDIETGWQQGGPVWLRIAPGSEAREVRMPERFDPYRFKLDRIWGVRRNELDVASVAWIAVPRER